MIHLLADTLRQKNILLLYERVEKEHQFTAAEETKLNAKKEENEHINLINCIFIAIVYILGMIIYDVNYAYPIGKLNFRDVESVLWSLGWVAFWFFLISFGIYAFCRVWECVVAHRIKKKLERLQKESEYRRLFIDLEMDDLLSEEIDQAYDEYMEKLPLILEKADRFAAVTTFLYGELVRKMNYRANADDPDMDSELAMELYVRFNENAVHVLQPLKHPYREYQRYGCINVFPFDFSEFYTSCDETIDFCVFQEAVFKTLRAHLAEQDPATKLLWAVDSFSEKTVVLRFTIKNTESMKEGRGFNDKKR